MFVYVLNVAFIFFLSFLLYGIGKPFKYKNEIMLSISFIFLFLISGLRFNVGRDYLNYTYTFILVNKLPNLSAIINLSKDSGLEIAFLLLNKLIGLFTSNIQWIFLTTSFITLFVIFKTIYKHSSLVWLSVYLFSVSGYLASFNILRQYIAISIIFYSYKYIKDNSLLKFITLVVIASLFHNSALLFLPLYFILKINLNIKKISFFTFSGIFITLFFNQIISLVQTFLYGEYTATSFGMTAGNINNVIIALIYFCLALFFKKPLLERSNANRILINWSFVNFILSLMSMKIWLITRLMDYSSIYLILLVPEIIVSVRDKTSRTLLTMIIILFTLVLYINNFSDPSNMLIPYQMNFG